MFIALYVYSNWSPSSQIQVEPKGHDIFLLSLRGTAQSFPICSMLPFTHCTPTEMDRYGVYQWSSIVLWLPIDFGQREAMVEDWRRGEESEIRVFILSLKSDFWLVVSELNGRSFQGCPKYRTFSSKFSLTFSIQLSLCT